MSSTGTLPRAVFFDMDDTILASSIAGQLAWDAVFDHYGDHFPGCDLRRFTALMGKASSWYWSDPHRHQEGRLNQAPARAQIMRRVLTDLDVAEQDFVDEAGRLFVRYRLQVVEPFTGALETLAELRRLKVPLALITNGEAIEQRSKIDKFDLAPAFDCVLVEGELGYGKPDPRVFQQALAALNVTAEFSWMVGDNLEWEVAGAQKLSLNTVWVDHTGGGLPDDAPATPHRTVRLISELLEQWHD